MIGMWEVKQTLKNVPGLKPIYIWFREGFRREVDPSLLIDHAKPDGHSLRNWHTFKK